MSEERKRMFRTWPDGLQALRKLSAAVKASGLESSLLELVKIRASQVNGCAYCIDMHTKDARAHGETEQRIYALNAWRETQFFSARERAALALTESLTLLPATQAHTPLDVVIGAAAKEFAPDELSRLVFAVVEINAWNRFAIATGTPAPGSYQPKPQD